MRRLSSKLENKTFPLPLLETKLEAIGFSIGGGWDYDHGSFDYKVSDEDGYQYLRLPFIAVDGQLDSTGATVKFQQPFVLNHQYQADLDDFVNIGAMTGSINQFQEPEDKDAQVSKQAYEKAKELLQEVEQELES